LLRLPAPVPAFAGDSASRSVGEAPANNNAQQNESEPGVSVSLDSVQQLAPATVEIDDNQMEEIHAPFDETREYKVFEYSVVDLFGRRHERRQQFLRALGPRLPSTSHKGIPKLNFGDCLSDPRLEVYSSPARGVLQH
jgi:hypothetical protein